VAGVEDPPGSGRAGGLDRRAVHADAGLAERVGGEDQHLGGVREGIRQALRVGEIPPPNPRATLGEVLGLGRFAHADADLLGGYAFHEPLGDRSTELAGGSGHDDHREPPECFHR
jgi:hypothetical protein